MTEPDVEQRPEAVLHDAAVRLLNVPDQRLRGARTLQSYRQAYSGNALQAWVADEYVSSTLENAAPLRTKARLVGSADTFLFAEGIFLAAAAALTLL